MWLPNQYLKKYNINTQANIESSSLSIPTHRQTAKGNWGFLRLGKIVFLSDESPSGYSVLSGKS